MADEQEFSYERLMEIAAGSPITSKEPVPDELINWLAGVQTVPVQDRPATDADEQTPKSWQPTIPFEPLTREIGTSSDPETEIVELTQERQHKILAWQEKAKKPYDLIQRAEFQAEVLKTYYGAGIRSTRRNQELNDYEREEKKEETGRAALYGLKSRINDHVAIADDRVRGSVAAKRKILKGWDLGPELDQLADSLQELGNDIAANMDNSFPGGHEQAGIAGNSVIALANRILEGKVIDLRDYEKLYQAAILNAQRQKVILGKKKKEIIEFLKVTKPKDETVA